MMNARRQLRQTRIIAKAIFVVALAIVADIYPLENKNSLLARNALGFLMIR